MTLNTVVQAAGPAPTLADDDAESVVSVREARFDACFRQHYTRVLAYALRRLPDRAAAEAFLIAWRRLDDISRDPLPWLLGIARHVIRNELRSSRPRWWRSRSLSPRFPESAVIPASPR
ncbi:MAG: RNA polymerase sigma factor [Solirubrobacteraceae bacterium]